VGAGVGFTGGFTGLDGSVFIRTEVGIFDLRLGLGWQECIGAHTATP
jgi:hypothetical protein